MAALAVAQTTVRLQPEPTSQTEFEPNRFLPLPLPPAPEGESEAFASVRFVPIPAFEELPPAPAALCELASALRENVPVPSLESAVDQAISESLVESNPQPLPQQDKVVGSDFPKKMTKTGGLELLSKPLDPYSILLKTDARKSRPEKQEFIENSWQTFNSLQNLSSQPDPRYLRYWPGTNSAWASPAFCYNPLYFEQPNIERYGIGYARPTNAIVSAGRFFCDVTLLPLHAICQPPLSCECTLGHRRPGDCNPIQR